MSNNGISKGTLLLLGGAAALLLSPSTRRRVTNAASGALEGAHTLFEDTIMPTAQELAEEARKRALVAQDELHDYWEELQKEVDKRRHELDSDLKGARRDLNKRANKAQKVAEKRWNEAQHEAKKGWLSFLDSSEETRRDLSKKAARAQQEARQGFFALRRGAEEAAHHLDKRAQREISGYQREIARLERQLAQHHRPKSSGAGALLPLGALAAAATVVLVPSVRKQTEELLRGVSPAAADCLNKAGDLVGTFWIEDMPAPKPAPTVVTNQPEKK